ncbi:uncharacterized protein [Haliaeetus albicilla]|uniref:uncharacterized protein n=1 Tax=Haliaeetus albicilla TaxID=8969 RepID=UPI0037E9C362
MYNRGGSPAGGGVHDWKRRHRCSSAGVPGPLEHRHPRTRLSGQRFGHRSRRAGRLPLPRRARLPSAPPPLSLFPKPPPPPVPAGGRSGPGHGRPSPRAGSGRGPPRRVLPCPEGSRGLGAVSEVPFGGADAVLVRFVWSPRNASAAGFAETPDCETFYLDCSGLPPFPAPDRPGQFGPRRRGVPWTPGHGLGTQTQRLDDPRTVSRSWGSPKRGRREERLVTALIVPQTECFIVPCPSPSTSHPCA